MKRDEIKQIMETLTGLCDPDCAPFRVELRLRMKKWQEIKQLDPPAVVGRSEQCEHEYQSCKHKALYEFDKCTKCGKIN